MELPLVGFIVVDVRNYEAPLLRPRYTKFKFSVTETQDYDRELIQTALSLKKLKQTSNTRVFRVSSVQPRRSLLQNLTQRMKAFKHSNKQAVVVLVRVDDYPGIYETLPNVTELNKIG